MIVYIGGSVSFPTVHQNDFHSDAPGSILTFGYHSCGFIPRVPYSYPYFLVTLKLLSCWSFPSRLYWGFRLMNEWIREEFKFSKNGANMNRIASHFILFSLPSFCSFYCYVPNCLRSMWDFDPYPDSTGRYDIAPSSAQAGTSWNQLSFCWSMKIIDRNGTGEPSGPSLGYPHEHLGAQASPTRSNRYPLLVPPSSNWSQQEPSVLCQHEHRGVQALLKLLTFELEILASPSRMRTKISTLGTFLNIRFRLILLKNSMPVMPFGTQHTGYTQFPSVIKVCGRSTVTVF